MERNKGGRPSKYSEELAEEIATALSQATCGLQKLCDDRDDFPHGATAWAWMHSKPGFREKIQRAREVQADMLVHQGVQILDDCDPQAAEDPRAISALVNLARARADYRLKLAPKIAPRTMGDRTALDIGGQRDAEPIKVEASVEVDELIEALNIVREVTRGSGG